MEGFLEGKSAKAVGINFRVIQASTLNDDGLSRTDLIEDSNDTQADRKMTQADRKMSSLFDFGSYNDFILRFVSEVS